MHDLQADTSRLSRDKASFALGSGPEGLLFSDHAWVDGTPSSGRGFALTSSDSDLSIDVRSPATPGDPASQ
jgi:hypothetical protein